MIWGSSFDFENKRYDNYSTELSIDEIAECDTVIFYINEAIFDTHITLCSFEDIPLSISPNISGTWTSSDDDFATISNQGVVQANGYYGCVNFTLTSADGCSYTTLNICFAHELQAPEVEDYELCVGETTSVINSTGTVYYSSNDAIATVNSNTGTVTCVSEGTTTIGASNQECQSKPSEPITCLYCSCKMEFTGLDCSVQDSVDEVVCIGDTSVIYFSDVCSSLILEFEPIKLIIENGTYIESEESHFTIVWNNEGNGSIKYPIYSFEGTLSHYITLDVLVLPKNQLVILDENNGTTSQEVCIGESIQLSIEDGTIDPIWEISDGSVLHGNVINISFPYAGSYTIKASAIDDCGCSLPAYYTVTVKDGYIPGITCTRTICVGEEVTYYSESECDVYYWTVSSQGTIIDGGGVGDYFITVQWNNGPIGEISLETPACSNAICEAKTTETIYILTPTVDIEGIDNVCTSDLYHYSVPDYTGTTFSWSIPSNGYIIDGNGSNSINVKWQSSTTPAFTSIIVDYENCNLGCSGHAELPITIRTNIFIVPIHTPICMGDNYVLSNNLGHLVNWEIIDPDGMINSYNNKKEVDFLFSKSGKYTIHITNNDGTTCNTEASLEKIISIIPSAPVSIDGPEMICLNTPAKYNVPNLTPNQTVIWEAYDGNVTTPTYSSEYKTLYITWKTTGPYKIIAKIKDRYTGCESTPTIKTINVDYHIEGQEESCITDEGIYTLTNFDNKNILNWTLNPSDAGTILSTDEGHLRILWTKTGTHQILADYCDFHELITVTVHGPAIPNIQYQDTICFGEKSTLVVTHLPTESFEVYDNNDILKGTTSPLQIGFGDYYILLTDTYGCQSIKEFRVVSLAPVVVSITLHGDRAQCPLFNPISITVDDPVSTYSYEWYKDGVYYDMGISTTITDVGNYYCIATNKEGCSKGSNDINMVVCCDSDPIPNAPSLNIAKVDIDCFTKDFSVLPTYLSENFSWNFGDFSFGTGKNVSHTYTKAGIYLVTVSGDSNCTTVQLKTCGVIQTVTVCEFGSIIVPIYIVADFKAHDICAENTVYFEDKSSKISTVAGEVYAWDFGDVSSGTNNYSSDTDPSHYYANPGTYTATLTLSEPGGCVSIKTRDIVVLPLPNIAIDVDSEHCIGSDVSFDVNTTEVGLKYRWTFGDSLTRLKNISKLKSPFHVFSGAGPFTITLTTTSLNGCVHTIQKTINIFGNDLNGLITSPYLYPKCEEDKVALTAPTAFSYLWSTGETTRTIDIINPGDYIVTIENAIGCSYTSPTFQIENVAVSDYNVLAKVYNTNGYGNKLYYDSLKICKGTAYDILCDFDGWSSFVWNTSNTGKVIPYSSLKNLATGRYWYNVDFEVGSCKAEAGPFLLEIIDIPDKPLVEAKDGLHCENQPITLMITNYNPSNHYRWSTGGTGESITVVSSGFYEVEVFNELGCGTISDPIIIDPVPSINGWMTGCIEVCFPKELCLNLPSNQTFEIIHDGTNIGAVTTTAGLLSLTEPGDYQLASTNSYGCQTISDLLTLTATPDEQSLSGIVYFDVDKDNKYTSVDSLLNNIPVYLYNGNTIVAQTITDMSGSYHFDSLNYANLRVVIDPSVTGLTYSGAIDSTLSYQNCIEAKNIDFPLNIDCLPTEMDTTYYVCPGTSILVNGKSYYENDSEAIIYESNLGCDSTINLNVLAYLSPDIPTEVSGSCIDATDGSITLFQLIEQEASYSLTYGGGLTTDSIVSNLAPGDYTLYIYSKYGCLTTIVLNIPASPLPEVDATTENTCSDMATGTINVITDDLNEVSIDGFSNSDQRIYNDLASGIYTIYVTDKMGCENSMQVTIDEFPALEVEVPSFPLDCYTEEFDINPIIKSHHGAINYLWSDATTNEQITISESGSYNLTVTDECDEQIFNWSLDVSILDDKTAAYAPNIFSPNNDNDNDCFVISLNPEYDILVFEVDVYDRWGSRIFHSDNILDCWDGTFKNRPVELGVFIYVLNVTVANCNSIKSIKKIGDVTVVR